jgi:hypothetical protein
MRFIEFKQRLLVGMYRRQKEIGFTTFMEPMDVVDAIGLLYEPGQIRLCLNEFKDMGFIRAAFTMGQGKDRGLNCHLTASGIEQAEEWAEEFDLNLAVPASDRHVTLDHNSPEYQASITAIDTVISEVQANRSNDFPDKEQRLSELRAGKILLEPDRVSKGIVLRVFSSALKYLALKFVDVPLGQAAQTAWQALLRLLGL